LRNLEVAHIEEKGTEDMIENTDQTIIVNGERRPYRTESVRELLMRLDINPERLGIAVALNTQVLPRDEWDETRLQPGDHVEIVQAIAGG
jgi:sulfur carrier protein